MSAAAETGFEEVIAELEKTITQLAEGTAPLDQLVTAHGRAVRLLADAQARLALLEVRAGQITKLLE
jgi:exodeoxyribonuclease VII small subunit